MNIEPMVGVGQFKLGVGLNDPLWTEIGEHTLFKRNLLQKNLALRFPLYRVVVYFDNSNLSAAIELLGNVAIIEGNNLMGLSMEEIKSLIGEVKGDFSREGEVIMSNSLRISLYTVKSSNRRVVDSVLVFNDSYLNNNDLAE